MKRMIKANSDDFKEMGQDIIEAWNAALTKLNIYEENIHTMSYEEIKKFEKVLQQELRDRQVDLSFKSLILPSQGQGFQIEGMKVGGNIGGIANNLIRGVIKKAWGAPFGKGHNLIEIIEDAESSGQNIYIEDKYGYCVPASANKAISLISKGDTTQYSGYGSQSYIDQTNVSVYEDYFGNVKVDRTTLRYD